MKTIFDKFQKHFLYCTLLFVMLFNCNAVSQTRTSKVNKSMNIETILKLLNSEIDSTSAYQIIKNNVHFYIQQQELSMPVLDAPPKYSANAPTYNISAVTSSKTDFSYDALKEIVVLTIHFGMRIHPIIIYNNGCFTRAEDRMIKSKWFQPEKIEVSFSPILSDEQASLNFVDVNIFERRYPGTTDSLTKNFNSKINNDIRNSTIKMFKSDEMKTLFKTILKTYNAD